MSAGDVSVTFTTNAEDAASQVNTLNDSLQQTGSTGSMAAAGMSSTWTNFGSTLGRSAVIGMVMMDRLSIAQTAVENAQIRATMAQNNYNLAVQKYGAGSREAIKAQESLKVAQDAVGISQQREEVRTLIMAGITIPTMIGGIGKLINTMRGWKEWNDLTTISVDGLTASTLALIGVATLGIGLIGALVVTGALGAGGGTTNNNVYANDINVNGVQGPAGFANTVAQSARP